jgi:hypothetical protein
VEAESHTIYFEDLSCQRKVPNVKNSPRSRKPLLFLKLMQVSSTSHMFIITAAPPKSAATPTAPVFIGIAMPLVLELAPVPDALAPLALLAVALAVASTEDGTGMPLVNGTTDALLAPEKAGLCVLAVTLG